MKYRKLRTFTYWVFYGCLGGFLLDAIFGKKLYGELDKSVFVVFGIIMGLSYFANHMLRESAIDSDKKECADAGELALVNEGNQVIKNWPLSSYEPQIIGSAFGSTIRLKDLQVEDNHATISCLDGQWRVKNITTTGKVDVISNNIMTLLKGQTHRLETGYIIQIGRARLRFTDNT